jgi:hypothetical protein
MLLHAKEISFLHPVSNEPINMQAELNAKFKRTLEMFKNRYLKLDNSE